MLCLDDIEIKGKRSGSQEIGEIDHTISSDRVPSSGAKTCSLLLCKLCALAYANCVPSSTNRVPYPLQIVCPSPLQIMCPPSSPILQIHPPNRNIQPSIFETYGITHNNPKQLDPKPMLENHLVQFPLNQTSHILR
jgi:hypothetical protein